MYTTAFPYLGKDETRDTSISVPTNIIMKLMQLFFKHGYNVTCNNFFTSLDVVVRLAKQKCGPVGTTVYFPKSRRTAPGCQGKATAA